MLDGSSWPPLASVEMVSELHHFILSLLMRGWFVLVKSMFLTCKRWKKTIVFHSTLYDGALERACIEVNVPIFSVSVDVAWQLGTKMVANSSWILGSVDRQRVRNSAPNLFLIPPVCLRSSKSQR